MWYIRVCIFDKNAYGATSGTLKPHWKETVYNDR